MSKIVFDFQSFQNEFSFTDKVVLVLITGLEQILTELLQ